jgi:hypothetical protein
MMVHNQAISGELPQNAAPPETIQDMSGTIQSQSDSGEITTNINTPAPVPSPDIAHPTQTQVMSEPIEYSSTIANDSCKQYHKFGCGKISSTCDSTYRPSCAC